MRWIWALGLAGVVWAGLPPHAAAQEDGKGAEAAAESDESADDSTAAERRRQLSGNVAKAEFNGKAVNVSYGDTPTEGSDYERLATLEDGALVQLTQSIVTKLMTDATLNFGDVTIVTENAAKDYPGVYGLWLKRVGDGWHLVFNEYADVWGSQHFPEGDVAEIPIEYAKLDAPTDKYTITVEETESGGAIRIAWGAHQWTAAFTVAG